MRNRIAALLCALVLLAGVPLALSAQISSPTFTNSSYLFMTDVDNAFGYQNYWYFGKLEGKSIFAGSFDSTTSLKLGYATKLGPVYLATDFIGNMGYLTETLGNNFTTTDLVAADYSLTGTRQDHFNPLLAQSNTANNTLDLLVGFGKIGIRASVGQAVNYGTDYYYYTPTWAYSSGYSAVTSITQPGTSYDTTGTVLTTTTVTPQASGYTSWTPKLAAGMELELGSMILRPVLKLDAEFRWVGSGSDYLTYKTTADSGLATYKDIANVSSYTDSAYLVKTGYTGISALLGSAVETGAWVFYLDYNFKTRLNGKSYLDADGTTSLTGNGDVSTYAYTNYAATLAQTTTTTTNGYMLVAKSYWDHTIDLVAQYSLPIADRFVASVAFQPNVNFNSTTEAKSGKQIKTVVTANTGSPTTGSTAVTTDIFTGQSESIDTITVTPILCGAINYKIIDKVLSFNMGTTILPSKLTIKTTSTTSTPGYSSNSIVTTTNDGTVSNSYTSNMGSDTRTENSSTVTTVSSLGAAYNWGLTWQLMDNVTLDTSFGSSSASLDLSNFTVMLSIKK